MIQTESNYCVHIDGIVQGVGFRPFIYRLAKGLGIIGTVENNVDGVRVVIRTTKPVLDEFIRQVWSKAPPVSVIRSIEWKEDPDAELPGSFTIIKGHNNSERITGISPDIAVCEDCLEDIKSPGHRHDYPFVNCTNCGPRFSIIRDLPYDRPQTSMADFSLCPECRKEYEDIADRRFHAQPVACRNCGPVYFEDPEHKPDLPWPKLRSSIITDLNAGKILAIQGIGGYHLICNALDLCAVELLRQRKHRDGKPFAVMFRNIDAVKLFCSVSKQEEAELVSWRRPIVLLKEIVLLNAAINRSLGSLGAMLPYTPLHYQLFALGGFTALVCTSGNLSEEPIIISPQSAENKLAGIADRMIHSDRMIVNRTDDSVLRIIDNSPALLRRSRGYVPSAVQLNFNAEGILATGSEQKNTFCIGKNQEAIVSQHIGDLKNLDSLLFFEESINRFCKLFRFKPVAAVTDLHPDFITTGYARKLGVEVIQVQHHHAHIASCLAEQRINGPVIGVAFDGTGMGTDETIWGGEFLAADLAGYERLFHLKPLALAGGDRVADEPWRMAVSLLHSVYECNIPFDAFPALARIIPKDLNSLVALLESPVLTIDSSGAGRYFDAVSAMTGCCLYNTFDSEAAIRLEWIADPGIRDEYPYELDGRTICLAPMVHRISEDLSRSKPAEVISAKFHNMLARIILDICIRIRDSHKLDTVVLSGGTFQNRLLTESALCLLKDHGFKVLINRQVPSNDGGLSLGQLAIAATLKNNDYVSRYPRPYTGH